MLWVDNECYVGPCRRQRRRQWFRFWDRRANGDGQSAPSMETLIRQLRVTNLSIASEDEQRRFRLRLQAAMGLAEDRGQHRCGIELGRLVKLFDATAAPRDAAEEIVAGLDRAFTALRG